MDMGVSTSANFANRIRFEDLTHAWQSTERASVRETLTSTERAREREGGREKKKKSSVFWELASRKSSHKHAYTRTQTLLLLTGLQSRSALHRPETSLHELQSKTTTTTTTLTSPAPRIVDTRLWSVLSWPCRSPVSHVLYFDSSRKTRGAFQLILRV